MSSSKEYREANKEKIRATEKAWREANKDKLRADKKAWREANKDRVKENHRVYYETNKDKIKEYHAFYYEANKEKVLASNREGKVRMRYGLSTDEYNAFFTQAGDKCPICKVAFDKTKRGSSPCLDHCHKTGEVRGVLCSKCNAAIGLLNDDCETLIRATQWLSRS